MDSSARYEDLRRAVVEFDLGHVVATLGSIPSHASPFDAACAMGYRMALWWAGIQGGALAEPEQARELVGRDRETDAAVGLVSAFGARTAYVGFDQSRLERWVELLGAVSGSDGELSFRHRIAEVWLRTLRGSSEGLLEICSAIVDDCRRAKVRDCLIDAQTCLALVACSLGDVDRGLSAARTACRMAKSEALPLQELHSHLALARLRRVAGTPYLASRILRSLIELSPRPLRPWLEWERVVAGGESSSVDTQESQAARTTAALKACLQAAAHRRREEFEARAHEAIESISGFLDGWLELQDLLICADIKRDSEAGSVAASEWVRGVRDMPPHGLHCVGLTMENASSAALSYVVASPGSTARRVLACGATMDMTSEAVLLDRPSRPQERTDTAAALLLLSPRHELRDREFFRTLYGFDYDVTLHKQIYDSLVYRLRARLQSAADVVRAGGMLSLGLHHPLVVWDPRCQRSLSDTVLDTLARNGPMTARDTAAAVGVSVRKIQLVLGEVVENECCVPRRSGRIIEYEVEDTIFSELTRSRFARKW